MWQQLQHGAVQTDLSMKQNKPNVKKFMSDLNKLSRWLDEVEGAIAADSEITDDVNNLNSLIHIHKVSLFCLLTGFQSNPSVLNCNSFINNIYCRIF